MTDAIDTLEQAFIEHALRATGGRVTEAANLLGISRKGLFLKRRRWGLREAS
jgi:DNA-binding NtrC family response regulator